MTPTPEALAKARGLAAACDHTHTGYPDEACIDCIALALTEQAQVNRPCPKHQDEGAIVIYCSTCLVEAKAEQARELATLREENTRLAKEHTHCHEWNGQLAHEYYDLKEALRTLADRNADRNFEQAREIERLKATLADLVTALDRCDENRGAFSTVDSHDLRCPQSRAKSAEEWKGEWLCKCGRENLDMALGLARAAAQGETNG